MASTNTWMVRAGVGGYLAEEFLKKGIVAIGWLELGKDLSNVKDLAEVKELFKKAYPAAKQGNINLSSGQIFRFKNEFKVGDQIITYNPQDRTYSLGNIDSDYEYNTKEIESYPHTRRVTWKKKIQRDDLSMSTKNSLGSIMTLFLIDKTAVDELTGKEIVSQTKQVEHVIEEKETLDY